MQLLLILLTIGRKDDSWDTTTTSSWEEQATAMATINHHHHCHHESTSQICSKGVDIGLLHSGSISWSVCCLVFLLLGGPFVQLLEGQRPVVVHEPADQTGGPVHKSVLVGVGVLHTILV
jgi:hypothetical protein